MEIREYDMMTDEARGIRTAAFVVEKDYRPEFDEWDEPGRATHLPVSYTHLTLPTIYSV